jgi:hypothetical protein
MQKFNPKTYTPSSETMRELSQGIQNIARLANYYSKRAKLNQEKRHG